MHLSQIRSTRKAFLLFSLFSTATTAFPVAFIYCAKHDALSFLRILSIVPYVWHNLVAFTLHFAYHFIFVIFALLLFAVDSDFGLTSLTAFLVAIANQSSLIYLNVVWYLARVIFVLEDYRGLDVMHKNKAPI